MSNFDKARARRFVSIALTVIVLLLPTLWFPPARDQSIFACVARVITRGEMPYRDIFELKSPGIYLAYAGVARVSQTVSGDDAASLMTWLRIADIFLAVIMAVLIALLARRLGHGEIAWPAAAWYVALYLSTQYWGLAQAEAWANPFAVAAMLCCLSARDDNASNKSLLWAGFLTGLVAVFKITAVLPLLPFWIVALRRPPLRQPALRQPPLRRAVHVSIAVAALLAPMLLAVWWLWRGGAWDAFTDIQRGFVAPYAALDQEGRALPSLLTRSGFVTRLGDVIGYTAGWMELVWFPVTPAIAGVVAGRGWRERSSRLLIASFLGGAAAVWLQHKYFYYHWQSALPALALLAALGVNGLLHATPLNVRRLPPLGAAVAVLWSLVAHWPDYRDAARVATGQLPRAQWLARFAAQRDFSFAADERVAAWVRGHTQPHDTIFIWGYEATIYWLADREPPTRFYFNQPLTATFTPRRWRDEFLRDVQAQPPELFIVVRNDVLPWTNGLPFDSAAQLRAWPQLHNWLQRHYRYETQIEDFTIYRYKGDTDGHG